MLCCFDTNMNTFLRDWCIFVQQIPHYRQIIPQCHEHITHSHIRSHGNSNGFTVRKTSNCYEYSSVYLGMSLMRRIPRVSKKTREWHMTMAFQVRPHLVIDKITTWVQGVEGRSEQSEFSKLKMWSNDSMQAKFVQASVPRCQVLNSPLKEKFTLFNVTFLRIHLRSSPTRII